MVTSARTSRMRMRANLEAPFVQLFSISYTKPGDNSGITYCTCVCRSWYRSKCIRSRHKSVGSICRGNFGEFSSQGCLPHMSCCPVYVCTTPLMRKTKKNRRRIQRRERTLSLFESNPNLSGFRSGIVYPAVKKAKRF